MSWYAIAAIVWIASSPLVAHLAGRAIAKLGGGE